MQDHVLREGTPEDAGMDPARIERLRELLGGWVRNGDTPSVAALVARCGVVVLNEAFGVLRHGDTTPTLRPDSIFPVASCSKPITAGGGDVPGRGRIDRVEPPVHRLHPRVGRARRGGWPTPGSPTCCATRQGSMISNWGLRFAGAAERSAELPPPAPGQHPTLNTLIRLAAGAPLACRPGAAMLYSSMGYHLLGDIVRRVSGQPFLQFVRSRIFEPLGMHDSGFMSSRLA